jgi:hypothetical protein
MAHRAASQALLHNRPYVWRAQICTILQLRIGIPPRDGDPGFDVPGKRSRNNGGRGEGFSLEVGKRSPVGGKLSVTSRGLADAARPHDLAGLPGIDRHRWKPSYLRTN